ncbi:MAG TPA: hypothetical protein VN048_13010 [Verrucomicrobiae bacterium]|jgi:hypothetical protein|nr:hypothetical protein [Verrucomicrobiae bacterium]
MKGKISGIILVASLLTTALAKAQTNAPSSPAGTAEDLRIVTPGSPFGIAWGFLYGYTGSKAEQFMPQLRGLGAGFTKVYLFWNQIEPRKGQYDWTAVDSFVGQLKSPDEGLIALFSSSTWAVKKPSAMLPPSAANNPDDYYRFVYDVVKHCKGRVCYWQNDCEPNDPVYWSGTKEEFVAELKVFYKAVKDADPGAVVIVGGYDGLFNPPGTGTFQFPTQRASLDFYDYVFAEGRNAFDFFDLRLYADPYTIVARVDYMRKRMHDLGFDKPIICTEYGGPGLFEFSQNLQYVPLISTWMQSVQNPGTNGFSSADQSGSNKISALYAKMSTLAPQTQMFMVGCSPELEAKHDRIQSRDLVMRNVLAFSAGVQKTLYWDLHNDPQPRDNLMTLMYGKIALMDYAGGTFTKYYPTANAYKIMAKALAGLRAMKRVPVSGQPSIFLFEADRGDRGPACVVWQRRDAFSGEDSPAVPFAWAWTAKNATAIDVLGQTVPVKIADGQMHLDISLTPIFIEPADE